MHSGFLSDKVPCIALLFRNALYLLPVLQCLCLLHAYRTGRPNHWYYIILIFPGIGSAIYIFTEILPGTNWNRTFDENLGFLSFFRKRKLARLEDAAEFSPTVQNRTALADELANQGHCDEAIELYQECLRGAMKDDSHLLFALAGIQEQAQKWEGILQTLARLRPEDVRRENCRMRRFQGVALDGLGRHEEAELIYRELLDGWPGDEIRCRLAVLLLGLNQVPEALQLCEQIKSHSKRGNAHYRQVNREWIRWAMHILKTEGKMTEPAATGMS